MKILHVGGFNPLNRFKTLEDALKKAKHDDQIILHKHLNESVIINKSIILDGNGYSLKIDSDTVGIKNSNNNHLVINNLTFIANTRANAIINEGILELTNVKMKLNGPVRKFLPLLYSDGSKLILNNCELLKVNTTQNTTTKATNCKFYNYYGDNIHIEPNDNSNEFSNLYGRSKFINCTLSHMDIDNAQI